MSCADRAFIPINRFYAPRGLFKIVEKYGEV